MRVGTLMELVIRCPAKAGQFAAVCGCLSRITKDVCFEPTREGLDIQALDDSKACLMLVSFPAEWFSHFAGEDNEATGLVCLSSEILHAALQLRGHDQTLMMKSDLQGDVVELTLGQSSSCPLKEFIINRLEGEPWTGGAPSDDWIVEASIRTSVMSDLLKGFGIFGEEVLITAREGGDGVQKLELSCRSENGSMKAVLEGSDVEDYTCWSVPSDSVLDAYGLENLSKSLGLSRFCDTATFSFPRPGQPCRVRLELGDGAVATYYVAPRIRD